MPASSALGESPSGILAPPLSERRSLEHPRRGAVAARDLDRYYVALRHELQAARLLESEPAALCYVLCRALFDAASEWVLPVEVEDALPEGPAARWEIDGPALAARLQAMLPARQLAIVDAAERRWKLPDHQGAPFPASLPRVGLVADADPAVWRGTTSGTAVTADLTLRRESLASDSDGLYGVIER
jgi:hypothetical protein